MKTQSSFHRWVQWVWAEVSNREHGVVRQCRRSAPVCLSVVLSDRRKQKEPSFSFQGVLFRTSCCCSLHRRGSGGLGCLEGHKDYWARLHRDGRCPRELECLQQVLESNRASELSYQNTADHEIIEESTDKPKYTEDRSLRNHLNPQDRIRIFIRINTQTSRTPPNVWFRFFISIHELFLWESSIWQGPVVQINTNMSRILSRSTFRPSTNDENINSSSRLNNS